MKILDLHQQTSLSRVQPESGFGDVGEGGIVLGVEGIDFSGDPGDGQIPIKNDTTGQIDWVTLLGFFGEVVSPAALSANTNDWAPTGLATSAAIRVDLSADWNLTGIVAPAATGERTVILLANISGHTLTLKHDATSSAVNRFYLPGSVDLALSTNGLAVLWYDPTTTRWRVTSSSIASGTYSAPITVKDEGVALATAATSLDFVGAGVTVSGTGAAKTITIPGGTSLGWFNVKDYGALGDGSTNDTAAINLAIAALNSALSGVLYFPAGTYITTGGLTTITAHALILGDGHGYADSHGGGGSEVRSSSATNVLFTVASTGARFLNIGLRCTAATPTAGSGILGQADFMRYDNIAVSNFRDCIDHQDGGAWKMDGCWIVGAVRYGVRVRNISSPDGGDQSISNSWFYADQRSGTAAIRLESGGGTKITNCKFNTFVSGHKWGNAIDIAPAATTTILLIEGCSIENYTGDGIHYAGGGWNQINVLGCQFGQYGNGTGRAVYIDGASDVIVGYCILRADTGTPTAVSLNNGSRALVGPFTNNGFATLLATSSYTSVDDRTTAASTSFGTPSIGYGTPAAGSASTAVRTDATIAKPTAPDVDFSADVTNNNVTSGHHGLAPKSPADATEFLNGAATPAFAAVKDSDLSTSDITTNDVSATKHGFAPKADGNAAHYLDGSGAYSTPPGTLGTQQHILLADGHATPFAFTDLLQMDDGSDFMWSDP